MSPVNDNNAEASSASVAAINSDPNDAADDAGGSEFPPGNTLQRGVLQQQLKKWKVAATGTTAALRERYDQERCNRCKTSNDTDVSTATAAASLPATAASEEKRLRRFVSHCPEGVRQRILRAKTQRLYLIHRGEIVNHQCEFAVLGSTGNIYTVTMNHLPNCTCPDFAKGHNHLCKHILFVMLKVMAIDETSPYLYQAAWLTSELQDMYAKLIERRGPRSQSDNAFLANDRVRQAYAKLQAGESLAEEEPDDDKNANGVVRKTLQEDDCDCPICFDTMMGDAPAKLTYCRTACGYNFHVDCIRRWCEQQTRSSGSATCPNCRQPWEVKGKSTGVDDRDEGYTNLGQLQGQSPSRDTSTYSSWNYKRRRYY